MARVLAHLNLGWAATGKKSGQRFEARGDRPFRQNWLLWVANYTSILSKALRREKMDVFQAGFEHLQAVAKLFDQYRVFYQAPSDFEAAKIFISQRLQENSSTIFIAC